MDLIHLLLVVGVAAVPPLALGGRRWPWLVAAAGAAAALQLEPGAAAAALGVPWLAAAVHATARTRRLAAAYGAVAAGAFVQSRLGLELLGVGEPFVLLTAVHYLYAGCGALALAQSVPGGRARDVAVVATGAAPPIVALGFVTGHALPQVGGAVVLAVGACTTATLELREVTGATHHHALLALSGLAVWVPMALAVGWAAAQHWVLPHLSIPQMGRFHGAVNALAFTIAGLAAHRAPSDHEEEPRCGDVPSIA